MLPVAGCTSGADGADVADGTDGAHVAYDAAGVDGADCGDGTRGPNKSPVRSKPVSGLGPWSCCWRSQQVQQRRLPHPRTTPAAGLPQGRQRRAGPASAQRLALPCVASAWPSPGPCSATVGEHVGCGCRCGETRN
eukprot:7301310-Lingulodinium_polyedra.AAC.1